MKLTMFNQINMKKFSVRDVVLFSALFSTSTYLIQSFLEFKAEILDFKEHISHLEESNSQLESKIKSLTSKLEQAESNIELNNKIVTNPKSSEFFTSNSVKIVGIVAASCLVIYLLPDSLNPVVYFYKSIVPDALQVWLTDNIPFMREVRSGVLLDLANQLRFDGTVINDKFLEVQVTLLDGSQTKMKLTDYILNLKSRTQPFDIQASSLKAPELVKSTSDGSLSDLVSRG